MMSRTTGRRIDEDAHIRQSVGDILTTPLITRVKRRPYGSMLPDLVDHPGNPTNRLRLMSATVMAIARWERRIAINTVIVEISQDGKATIEMQAVKRTGGRAGQPITIVKALA